MFENSPEYADDAVFAWEISSSYLLTEPIHAMNHDYLVGQELIEQGLGHLAVDAYPICGDTLAMAHK